MTVAHSAVYPFGLGLLRVLGQIRAVVCSTMDWDVGSVCEVQLLACYLLSE